MTVRWIPLALVAVVALAAVGLCVLLVLMDDPFEVRADGKPAGTATGQGPEGDPTLTGTGVAGTGEAYADADLRTTLGAFRFQPPHVPPGAVARLAEYVTEDPDLLDHLVRVALREEDIRDGLLPDDYPFTGFDAAIWALQGLGRTAAGALAKRLLPTSPRDHQITLLHTLQRIGAEAEPATEALIAVLRETSLRSAERRRALHALFRIGLPARAVVPDLLAILRDPDDPLFEQALRGVYPIAGMTPEVAQTYVDLLAHDDPYLVMDVLLNIQNLRPEDCEVLRSQLEMHLDHEQPDVRRMAMWALVSIGVKDAKVARQVGHLMEDEGEDAMQAAATLLRRSGRIGYEELLDVAKRAEFLAVSLEACKLLGGHVLADHTEILARLFREGEGPVLGGAASLLRSISPGPPSSVFLPLLTREIDDPESRKRWLAVHILPNVRGDDDAVLALLTRALDDSDLFESAVGSLGTFHRRASQIVPILLKHLETAPYSVADALVSLARRHPPARAALRRIAETHESEACQAAASNALLTRDDTGR